MKHFSGKVECDGWANVMSHSRHIILKIFKMAGADFHDMPENIYDRIYIKVARPVIHEVVWEKWVFAPIFSI